MGARRTVLVLGGGPDAEREVSLESSRCVAEALAQGGRFDVRREVIGAITRDELRALAGDVIFPVLHGGFGEGGPLQDLLVADGRPFVGCGPVAARTAMDKLATKLAAARVGVPTAPAGVFHSVDHVSPLGLPAVLKPVHEGSSVGVHICRDGDTWEAGVQSVRADVVAHPSRVYMVERAILGGRELTVGVLDGRALPVIEIVPKAAFYDYHAKYHSDETKYVVSPQIPAGVGEQIQAWALALAREIGVRHLCRVDYILDPPGAAWLLEVNTMPGFTSHSLLPMAAAAAGLDFPRLTEKLVDLALAPARG